MKSFRSVLNFFGNEWEIYPVVLLFGIWYSTMIDGSFWNDEVIYVSSSASILNGNIFVNLEHPPLAKYIIAFFILIFGETNIAARSPSILFSMATIYLTYKVARLYTDRPRSVVTASLVGFSGVFISLSTQAMLDIYLAFFVILLFYLLLLYLKRMDYGDMAPGTRKRWLILLGVFSAFTVLTKLYGIFFACVAFYIITRNGLSMKDHRSSGFLSRIMVKWVPAKEYKWLWLGFIIPILLVYIPYVIRLDLVFYYLIGFNAAHASGGHSIIVDGLEYTYPPIHTYLNWIYSNGLIFIIGLAVSGFFLVKDLRENKIIPLEKALFLYTFVPLVFLSILYVKFMRYLLPLIPLIAIMTLPLLPKYLERILDWVDGDKIAIRTRRGRIRLSLFIVILLIFLMPSSPVKSVRRMDLGIDSHFQEAGDYVADLCRDHPDCCIKIISFYDQSLEYYLEKDHPDVRNYELQRLKYDSEEIQESIISRDADLIIDIEPNERFMDEDIYWIIRNECIRSHTIAGNLRAFTLNEIEDP